MLHGYTRVSTHDQARSNATSLAMQERVIHSIAMARDIAPENVRIHSDPGISGALPLYTRPGGSELMAAVKPGDLVAASKLDRMFRDALDAQSVWKDFKARGIHLILYDLGTEPVTSSGGLSKVFFQIVSVFADAERERIAERMRDGRKAKLAKGGHAGGEAPYGWRIVGRGRDARLEINDAEQEVIAQAAIMRQKEISIAQVARELNRRGLANREGGTFRYMQVQRMLKGVACQAQ